MKIAHMSDNHLRVKHLGLDARGLDFYNATVDGIRKAHAAGARLILNTGDLFHEPNLKSKVANTQITSIHELLKKLGMVMLVIEGNHEQTDPPQLSHPFFNQAPAESKQVLSPLPGITLLNNNYARYDGLLILGIGSCSTEAFHNTLLGHLEGANPEEVNRIADVLMWHAPIREFCGYPDESAITLEQMPLDHFGLILMGDIHQWDYREYTDRMCRFVGYPGATEMDKINDPLENYIAIFDVDTSGSTPVVSPPQQIRVDSLPKYGWQVTNELELEKVLDDIRKIHGRAMLMIRYNTDIPACAERLDAVVDQSRIILRKLPIGQFGDVVSAEGLAGTSNREADLKSILHGSFSIELGNDPDFVNLAESCLKSGADYRALLSQYIQTQLAK